MLIFILAWHILANARTDEVVGGPRGDYQAQPFGLIYERSGEQINMNNWKFKGRKVAWEADSLVDVKCDDNGVMPPIRVSVMTDFDNYDYECQDTVMSEHMAKFIDSHLKSCIQSGMGAAGLSGGIKNIDIEALGVMSARRVNTGEGGCKGQELTSRGGKSCSISYHATGRALDVAAFNVTLENGRKLTLPASCKTPDNKTVREGFTKSCERQGPMGKFYDRFMECWDEKLAFQRDLCERNTDRSCGGLGTGAACSEKKGALGCDDNDLHHNHMHLSLPLCPLPRGIATK